MVIAYKESSRPGRDSESSVQTSSTRQLSLRTQDSDYLREASQVARALPLGNLNQRHRESPKQFDLSEVVRGGGRAVYALEDENRIMKALNTALGINDGNRFAGTLDSKLKGFQREMIATDPGWQKLEASLRSQGKTLADGLVGPLTVKALLDRGVIRLDRVEGVVAVTRSHSAHPKALLHSKDIVLAKDAVGIKDAVKGQKLHSDEGQQAKGLIKLKQDSPRVDLVKQPRKQDLEIKKEGSKSEAPIKTDQRLVDLQKSLEELKAKEKKLSLSITDNINHIKSERLAITKSEIAITKARVEFEKKSKLLDCNLPFATSASTILREKEESLNDLRNQQNKLRGNIEIIEKSLVKISNVNEDRKSKLFDDTRVLIAKYNKEFRDSEYECARARRGADSSVAFANKFFDSFKSALKDHGDMEARIGASIAKQDPEQVKKYTLQAMPWTKEEQYTEIDRRTLERGFSLCFSKLPADSLAIYQNELNSTFTRGSGIEFGMRYGDNFNTFLANLDSESRNDKNGLSLEARRDLSIYVSSLKKCKELGIDSPLRFSPSNLAEIVNERINPQINKPLMVITAAKADWNGAFGNLDRVASKFISQGYRVQYREISSDLEFVEALKTATQDGQFKAEALCVSGHGSKKQISLSDYDPAKYNVSSTERTIDLGDKDRLAKAREYVNSGASILINSCSTGEGKLDPTERLNNMANFFRDLFPQVALKSIFAPTIPANIGEIEFKDRKVVGIKSVNKRGEEVDTYQASATKVDSRVAGLI